MRLRLTCFPLAVLSLLASGCIEMTQEVWIEKDGSARLVRDVIISQELLNTPGEMLPSAHGLQDGIMEGLNRSRDELQMSPLVASCEVSDRVDGPDHHFILDVRVKDALRLGDVDRMLQENSSTEGGSARLPGAWNLEVTERRNGHVVVRIVAAEDSTAQATGGKATDKTTGGKTPGAPKPGKATSDTTMSRVFLDSFFAGKDFRVVVHGPKIVSSTGTISDDRTSAEWVIPMSRLAAKSGFDEDVVAEVRLRAFPWLLVGAVGGGALGAGGIGIGLARQVKKRRAGAGSRRERKARRAAPARASHRGHWRTVS